jgi:hypothetical protein
MATYSFLDVNASIVGPGGAFSLSGEGNSDEGITISMTDEKDVLTIGADGTPMHTLVASKAGKVSIHLLKTSPVNAKLMALYDAQSLSSALWGKNTITMTNSASGDTSSARSVAFVKVPDMAQAKEAGTNTWEFNAGMVDSVLGTY